VYVSFTPWLAAWIVTAAAVVVLQRRSRLPTSGLVFAYLASLFVIHWVAAAIYALPTYRPLHTPETVLLGFQQSVYAVAAFAVGSAVLAPVWLGRRAPAASSPGTQLPGIGSPVDDSSQKAPSVTPGDIRLALIYIGLGAAAFVGLLTAASRLATITALVAAAEQLFPLGLCLLIWVSWKTGHRRLMFVWVGVALLLPLVTISYEGFASFGVAASIVVASFAGAITRARLLWIVAIVLLAFLGLSFFVTYFRDRAQIRHVVWGGQGYSTRLQQLQTTFVQGFQWFDLGDERSLHSVDQRLNQNYLVGAAVNRLDVNGDFANGTTLVDAAIALVPRVLWPDKPVSAGSGGLVTRFTGLQYATGTSVGIGHVMEFYVNFGTIGVLLGFAVLGCLLTILDVRSAQCLRRGDHRGFALSFLVGVSLLQVGGSLVEATASAGASVVVVLMIHYVRKQRAKRVPPMQPDWARVLGPPPPATALGD
jgi:hypothetical protein